ncbi:MAG TPA: peptide ABC transporter substrate-binding protein [Gemmatimonadaceae bacterium]|nr:peptide ABC transporter substrate-binding protein [Gemmatimonadaceae bacterium]
MRFFIATCSLLVLSGACADRAGTADRAATGGTIVVVVPGNEPSPLFPPLTIDIISKMLIDQIYDRLAEIGPGMNTVGDAGFQPRLARSWTWSPDSLSIAFDIDPRARWHDGKPVRASDVAFTVSLDKDPKTATQLSAIIANVDSVTVRDSLTAVAWFHKRTPEQFYDFVYQVQILPEHILKDIPRDKLGTSEVIRKPIGTGRFRFARWEPGVRIELVADTANFRGRAKLDRVIVALAADAGSATTQLMSGQADWFENIQPDLIARLDSAAPVRPVRYQGTQYAYMGMNQRDPKRLTAPHPIFSDRQVRRALSMALDRQAMLKNMFDTLGVLGLGPFTRGLADTTVVQIPFDRAHAAALLDSAGWRPGPDGIRVKNGKPLAFGLLTPTSSAPRMRYAVMIQEQLKSVGVRVDIESMDFTGLIARLEAKNFDAAMMSTGSDPARAAIKQNWATEGIGKGLQNQVSYSNRVFDALIDSAIVTFDKKRSDQYAHRAYQTLVDDAPAVWLYDILTIAGAQKRLRPEGMRPDGWWVGLADWWIPANERIERDRIGLRPSASTAQQ